MTHTGHMLDDRQPRRNCHHRLRLHSQIQLLITSKMMTRGDLVLMISCVIEWGFRGYPDQVVSRQCNVMQYIILSHTFHKCCPPSFLIVHGEEHQADEGDGIAKVCRHVGMTGCMHEWVFICRCVCMPACVPTYIQARMPLYVFDSTHTRHYT